MSSAQSKHFSTAAIASITSGKSLCSYREMREAAAYLMGQPVSQYQFADEGFCLEMQQKVLEQHPEMPTSLDYVTADNYRQAIAELEAKFGKTVLIHADSEALERELTEERTLLAAELATYRGELITGYASKAREERCEAICKRLDAIDKLLSPEEDEQ